MGAVDVGCIFGAVSVDVGALVDVLPDLLAVRRISDALDDLRRIFPDNGAYSLPAALAVSDVDIITAVKQAGILQNTKPLFFCGRSFLYRYGFKCSNFPLDFFFCNKVSGILGPIPAGFQAISCLTGSFACALFATSIGGYVNDLLPFIPAQIASITFLTLFFVINLFGVNIMAKVQKLMTWCLLAALMLFIVFGLFHLQNPIFDFHSGDFLSGGFKGFVSATMLLYYSTTGHYLTMNYSRTAQNATRDIPWAMLMATPVLLVVYCGVAIVATGVLPMADTAGRSLAVVAQSIFPAPLFILFIIFGPMFALFTTMNGTMAGTPYMIAQSAFDGWLPKSFADKNKHGVFWKILVFVYLYSLIPVIFNFSTSEISNNMLLFSSFVTCIQLFAYFRMPSKFPEAWKRSRWHVPNPVYYLCCALCAALNIFVLFNSFATLNPVVAIVSGLLIVLAFVYAIIRMRSAKVVIQNSAWVPSED